MRFKVGDIGRNIVMGRYTPGRVPYLERMPRAIGSSRKPTDCPFWRYIVPQTDEGALPDTFTKPEFVDELLSHSINLLSSIFGTIYFRTFTNSLKDIARFLGFRWTNGEASGAVAVLWRLYWDLSFDDSIKSELVRNNTGKIVEQQRSWIRLSSRFATRKQTVLAVRFLL